MKRRLIQQGFSGYTLTLPIGWIREHHLQPGEELDIQETKEGLLVRSADKMNLPEKVLELDISTYSQKMILNLLYQAYRLGYGTLRIKYKNQEQFSSLRELAQNYLLGFEVVENSKNQCVLQNIAEPEKNKFEVILRRHFLQILELSEIIGSAFAEKVLEEKKNLSLEQLRFSRQQLDKMSNYLRRAIVRDKISQEKAPLIYALITNLSLISHDYLYLYEYWKKQNRKGIGKEIKPHLQETNLLFRQLYESFYQKDYSKMDLVGKGKVDLFQKSEQLLENSEKAERVILAYLREIIRLIQASNTLALGYHL